MNDPESARIFLGGTVAPQPSDFPQDTTKRPHKGDLWVPDNKFGVYICIDSSSETCQWDLLVVGRTWRP